MKVGRNDPCPCGSGKKYKRCCLSIEEAAPPVEGPAEFMEEWAEIKEELRAHEWSSREEAEAFLTRRNHERNIKEQGDLHGLSPDPVFRLIFHPGNRPTWWSSPPGRPAPARRRS